ncbi:MAG: VCBS repeat-containing protein [Proteobacteria bacterium]|nr:VCBS repeat-containing protein [Pseudomonadota bacterium]MBU0965985.1 VCBS repeat-containing protein [Pseudomonadota bacterium]
MKIAASSINLTATHASYQQEVTESSLTFWRDEIVPPADGDRVTLTAQARNLTPPCPSCSGADAAGISPDADGLAEDPELRAMRLTLELLTGRRIRVATFQAGATAEVPSDLSQADNQPANAAEPSVERLGWGMEYDYSHSYSEQESVGFSAQGQVITADGRQLDLAFDLQMQRQFQVETRVHLQAGDARLVDPLVINFNGQGVRLGDMTLSFDLDGDAQEEEIAFVAPGSGFLVLDRNNDGKVNNGTELFGPASGHGFLELAEFDTDGNGWLDENDPIFTRLKVWMADQAGNQQLVAAADMGIGALLLSPVDTQFKLTDSANNQLGQIRQTSLALLEDGTAAAVQEIDLVV